MANTDSGRSFQRRDKLLEMEHEVRKWWDESDVFIAEAQDKRPKEGEKFFGTFPFPYMNGYLHLGHAFSLSKLEFAAAYHRMRGANVLLPFAFHCTGMPIKASADKLRREIERFGNPPVFPSRVTEKVVNEPETMTKQGEKFKGKKSKMASKTGKEAYQWEIMRAYGLSDAEIATFQDPVQWLRFFPPLAVEDLKAFGLGADWRRSFITTDINPYFDKFVRWQMRKLKSLNNNKKKIVRDKRYTIYSPLDGQPCADHDRASGEGVIPQEYTLIKMEVDPPFPSKFEHLEGKKVYLAAATLRPETMYGQTNVWVLPDGKYGAFEIDESDVFILTERAARNLAFQGMSRVPEKATCIVELTGQDLIGLPLRSPLSLNEVIYCLPMLSVLIDKGTGIVTSVPSDSPDDFVALQDLKAKAPFRAKFGVKDEWVIPFEAIPIICHPEFGDKSAEKRCTDMKIKSQNEREKLDTAKKLIHKGGFYEGTMITGEYAVQDAKNKIQSQLIGLKQAVKYSEPEKKVMSRSGDECVVALTDQWYINYGESSWLQIATECLANMNLYSEDTRNGFKHTLSWLKQWACSRSFGLGTRIPWDEQFLVESLSDSTIYMAYYTVCHLIQNGDIFGADTSALKPEQLTDDVWDYIFLSGPEPKASDISTLREGAPCTYADRVFANEMNFAIKVTEKNYNEYMFREALKSGFYDLQTARDEYRFSCGSSGMKRDLLWRFMDVQTRLIAPICPHYSEYVWKKVLKKEGFVIKAGWPEAEDPDLALHDANRYLQKSITKFSKLLMKQASKKEKPTTGLIFVNEEYDGWQRECLNILRDKFDSQKHEFAPDQEIQQALQQSAVGLEGDFKRIQKLCMPFLKSKKDEVMTLGIQELDLRPPFSEIQVLQENLELIKRRTGLEHVEILSATEYDAAARHALFLKQTPPSPGSPTPIFLAAMDDISSFSTKIVQ